MDIQVNENVVEKVKSRDILSVLRDIFAGTKTDENDEKLNQKLQGIYKVQSDLGVTKNIATLEKDLETHEVVKKKRTARNSSKESKINSVEEKINSVNNKEIQDEEKEL